MAQKLGQVAEGKLVKIKENGSLVEFYVAKQNYESVLNGQGRTLLVRKDTYDTRSWSNIQNAFGSSQIYTFLNYEYVNTLDDWLLNNFIKFTKYYYTRGNGNTSIETESSKIFLLSLAELGLTSNTANQEGTALPISETLKTANTTQWTRTPSNSNTSYAVFVNTIGNPNQTSITDKHGCRPIFTVLNTLYVDGDGTIIAGPDPTSIETPVITMQGKSIPVSWGTADGADSYILQRKTDGGDWTEVYAGDDLTFTDTAGAWATVQYQVCGVFGGVNGAFAKSEVITVLPASALSIGGTDGDLGALTSDVPYSVATNTGKNVTMDLAVNGVNVFHRADATTYTGTLSVLDLPTGMGSIVIAASVQADSGMVTAERKWTYTKPAQPFPASGGVAALTKDGKPLFPQTLAECVRTIGGPWGGNLSTALDKLATAATYTATAVPKYTEVKVDLGKVKAEDIVNLPVKGIMTPHIVVQVGNPDPAMYDASCDGVWLLRQNIVENGQWNSTNVNTLAGSTIMTTMQGYVTDYDSTVQAAMLTVKIPYCTGGGNTTINTLANGLQCKMFPLSGYEVGWTTITDQYFPVDGVVLSYFQGATSSKRVAYLNENRNSWSLRSPRINYTDSNWMVAQYGNQSYGLVTGSNGIRPCFLLPTTFTATYYVDTEGNVHPSQEYTNGGDFYDLWGEVIPTVKIATGSYVGTGTYGVDNPNTLTFPFEPKVVFIGYGDTEAVTIRGSFCFVRGAYTAGSTVSSSSSYTVLLEWDGNTVSWYSGTNQGVQLNATGKTYYYVAIG